MLVEYIKDQGTVQPEVDNNWRIIGVNLDYPYRNQIIEMVNRGDIEVPYDTSLNIDALRAAGIIE
jgi:hypothetical protein